MTNKPDSPNTFDQTLLTDPIDDQLPMRSSGSWVIEKLHYVKKYIDMFTTSMHGKPWRNRRYIDLFSGPGKCVVRETGKIILGSPLISLKTRYPFTDYIFIDKDDTNIDALQQRCSPFEAKTNINYSIGDSNLLVKEVVRDIISTDKRFIKDSWSSLNLAFLDPEGLELEWRTVEALASVTKMDLIIHYSQAGLNRNLDRCFDDQAETIIDRFFGDRTWRSIFDQERKKSKKISSIHRALIDHYKSKLVDLGYVDVHSLEDDYEPLMKGTPTNVPLYRLLFASKHELGHDFWSKVTQKDVYGQARLF